MSAITLSEEQTKLFRLCLKHSEPLKPDWDKVAKEGEFVSSSAASQRWGRLHKILTGDEKPSTPSKGKGSSSKTGEGTPKQRKTTKKKAANAKADKISDEDGSVKTEGNNTAEPAPQTPKKRERDTEPTSNSEGETPSKVEKIMIKKENQDMHLKEED